MTLLDVVAQLATLDPEHVIYAAKPWTPSSRATVSGSAAIGPAATASAATGAPAFTVTVADGAPTAAAPTATHDGLARLVDVADAQDFFSGGWADGLTPELRCERLIQYATFDA